MDGRDPGHLSYAFSIRSSNTSSLHLLREISPRLYSNPEYYIRIHKDPTEIFHWHQPPKDIHTMISRSCGYRDHSQISSITITAIISINDFASTRKLAPCLTSELAYVNSFVNRIREVELISTYRIPQLFLYCRSQKSPVNRKLRNVSNIILLCGRDHGDGIRPKQDSRGSMNERSRHISKKYY